MFSATSTCTMYSIVIVCIYFDLLNASMTTIELEKRSGVCTNGNKMLNIYGQIPEIVVNL